MMKTKKKWFLFTFLGKFDLEGIDQHDWEDITMLEYNGVDYIYVGDIGNNYDGHCRGINYEDMAIYRFPEPELSSYKYDSHSSEIRSLCFKKYFQDYT